jgi:hypothetical protein
MMRARTRSSVVLVVILLLCRTVSADSLVPVCMHALRVREPHALTRARTDLHFPVSPKPQSAARTPAAQKHGFVARAPDGHEQRRSRRVHRGVRDGGGRHSGVFRGHLVDRQRHAGAQAARGASRRAHSCDPNSRCASAGRQQHGGHDRLAERHHHQCDACGCRASTTSAARSRF